MTLSDLGRWNVRGQIFHADLRKLIPSATRFCMVTQGRMCFYGLFVPQYHGTYYIPAQAVYAMRHNNQILHDDQTR